MIDILLFIVIIAILAYHAYSQKQNAEERQRLINTIVAKNAQELRDLTLAGNTEIKVEPPREPDLTPLENLSDSEHYKAILKHGEKEELE